MADKQTTLLENDQPNQEKWDKFLTGLLSLEDAD